MEKHGLGFVGLGDAAKGDLALAAESGRARCAHKVADFELRKFLGQSWQRIAETRVAQLAGEPFPNEPKDSQPISRQPTTFADRWQGQPSRSPQQAMPLPS